MSLFDLEGTALPWMKFGTIGAVEVEAKRLSDRIIGPHAKKVNILKGKNDPKPIKSDQTSTSNSNTCSPVARSVNRAMSDSEDGYEYSDDKGKEDSDNDTEPYCYDDENGADLAALPPPTLKRYLSYFFPLPC